MIKKTDIITALTQALNENQGIGTYNINKQVIVDRTIQLLEIEANKKQVLLD